MRKPFALVALFVSAAALCSVIYALLRPHLAKFRPFEHLSWYDLGLYGAYPTQTYKSIQLQSLRVDILHWDDRCDQAFVFLTPRGISDSTPGPTILDSEGDLVWKEPKWGEATDLKVQRYQGDDYLTFWAGIDDEGHGKGLYYMLDSSYNVAHTLGPVGAHLSGDLHEFQLTENGTALISIYDVVLADLSSLGGPASGWIFDCVFQEIDIATGALVFEWRASEHYQLNETFIPLGSSGRTEVDAFDFFHINSVDKDPDGNYYVSSRCMHTVTCITPAGDILWKLGGRRNDFNDLSGGAATNFSWQHDARWHPNNTITLFDNAAMDYKLQDAEFSQGMVIDLDLDQMTAILRNSYAKPGQFRSASQGSMQLLPDNGNVLIGWGHSAAYTEFAHDGEILCDVHFGASSVFGFGRITSYRAFKSEWVGLPSTPPEIRMVGGSVFVSWNGATEIANWELQSAQAIGNGAQGFRPTDRQEKEGFEAKFSVPKDTNLYLRVAALDNAGDVLGVTDVLDRRTGLSATRLTQPEIRQDLDPFWLVVTVCAFLVVGLCGKALWVRLNRRPLYERLPSVSSVED